MTLNQPTHFRHAGHAPLEHCQHVVELSPQEEQGANKNVFGRCFKRKTPLREGKKRTPHRRAGASLPKIQAFW